MKKLITILIFLIFSISLLSFGGIVLKVSANDNLIEELNDFTEDINVIMKKFQIDCVNKNSGYYYVYKEDFAGMFFDDFGNLNVALINNANSKDIEFIEKRNINCVFFEYSYNFLQDIMNKLEIVMNDYEILSIEINDKNNNILVSLADANTKYLIEQYLNEQEIIDLEPIVFEIDVNNSIKFNSREINGAELAYKCLNSSSAYSVTICSNAVNDLTGELGIITCGHLGPIGTEVYYDQSASDIHNYSTPLGETAYSCIGNSIDASFIPFLNQEEWVISSDANYSNNRYSNIYLGNDNQIVNGRSIARIGQITGYTTGTISSTNVTVNINGASVSNSFKISSAGAEGDSGGPVFYANNGNLYLIGLYYATETNWFGEWGIACRISNIMSQFGVTPITNDSFYIIDLLDGTIQLEGINFNVSGEFNIPYSIQGKTITEIGNNTFQYYSSLTKVVLPNTITSIGSYAFEGCTSLENVTILNEKAPITNLGLHAFDNCASDLTITVPTNRLCEYKNTPFWSSYKNKIVPLSPIDSSINIDCMSDFDETVYLNPGYNKLYCLDVECSGWYTISCSSGAHFNIYNSNMEIIASSNNLYELTLSEGTYYIDVEWENIEDYGNVTLHFFNKGISVTDNINNNILPHLHNVGSNYKAQLKYYHNHGAGFYKFSLSATSSTSNPVKYNYGAITMYTDYNRNTIMNKYSDNNYTLQAKSLEDENSMIVYLPSNGYYYFDVKMNTNSLSSLVLNITPYISSDIDLFDCSVSSNHDIHIINTNVKGDYFQKNVLKQKGKFIISFTYTDPDPDPNNISSSDVVVVVTKVTYNANTNTYSFTKVYSVDFCEEDLLFTSYIITNSLDLDAGTYYIGYFNNTDCANIKVDFVRQITQYGSYNLISDPNSSEEYGSEVRFNNGSYLGSTLTVGFTRFIYLNYDYILPSYSRLDYYFYSSNESIATISEYGTLLGKSAGTVKIMAVYKSDPSITFVKQFTILADNRVNNLIIYDTDSIDYTGSGLIYQIELDDYNSYFPQISLYNWSLISSSNNYTYSISEWGTFSLYGADIIVIEGTSQLNSKLKIRITITVTN